AIDAADAGADGAVAMATVRRLRDERLDRLAAVTATDEYRDAFADYIETGHDGDVLRATRDIKASLTLGNSGGYLVPVTIDPTIITTGATSSNPIRARATVRQIVGTSQKFPTVDDVAAGYGDELADPSADGTDVGGPTITAHRAQALLQASPELEEDYAMTPDLAGTLFREAKDRVEQTKFTLGAGDGSTEPWGLITRIAAVSGSRVATATGDTLVWADIYKALGSLPQRFRRSGGANGSTGWMLNILMINLLRQLAGTDPQYAGAISDPTADRPSQILGYWLDENSDMDGVLDDSANNDVAIVGDFSRFIIADRLGAVVEYIPHYIPSGSSAPRRAWWLRWRNGSDVRDTNAFRLVRA
ncbi:MAG TPA: phage major capsid protein, partial [Microthrixaceae bacterium]|nr:phage major capsid protein [Microthrixaceae bacterium]